MNLSLNLLRSRVRFLGVLAAAAVLAAGCADGGDDGEPVAPTVPAEEAAAVDPGEAATTTEPPPTAAPTATTEPPPPTTAPLPSSPPYRAELPSGSFLLADRIAAKLTQNQTLSFALSVGTPVDEGSGPALVSGFTAGAAESAERHGAGTEAVVFGDVDVVAQAARIDEMVVAGGADCLVVEVAVPDDPVSGVLATAIDKAVNSGVPVFTVSGDSAGSRRFAFYGLDPLAAGRRTGETVGRWAVDGRILVRKAGVLTGDARSERSQQLMEGFIDGLTLELPDVEFVNGPGTVESFGFDPNEVYDETAEWILDRPDVDIIFFTDAGMEYAATVIADLVLYGDVSVSGFHMSERVSNYIREGVVVAAMLPGLADQASDAAEACGDFLLAGAYATGHVAVDPVAVTDENVEDRDWTLPENR